MLSRVPTSSIFIMGEADINEVVGAERTMAAMSWLRNFLSENTTPAEAVRQTAGLEPTPTTIQTIESIKAVIAERTREADEICDNLNKETERYKAICKDWNHAGGNLLREQLDPDAIAEVDILANLLAALSIPPEHALCPAQRISALTRVAEKYVAAEDLVARRSCTLLEGQGVLREAADHLRNNTEAGADVRVDIEKREAMKRRDAQRASVMRTKAKQYDMATAEFEKQVQRSGVLNATRHENVAQQGGQLRLLEKQLADAEKELKKYRDLPAVRYHLLFYGAMTCQRLTLGMFLFTSAQDIDACREVVADLHRKIEDVDADIEIAINSIM